jgi:hypothetical protein
MSENRFYTTQLQAGLGLITETRQLLELYEPGVSVAELTERALSSGRFPLVTARRLRNIVAECFAPRYLRRPNTAAMLKHLRLGSTAQSSANSCSSTLHAPTSCSPTSFAMSIGRATPPVVMR